MTIGSARLRLALAAGIALAPFAAYADIAVSANDNKAVLENGVTKVVANPQADTVSIIDLSANPPKLVAEIQTKVMDQTPWIPIVAPAVRLYLNKRVTGVPASFVYLYYPWAADLGAA